MIGRIACAVVIGCLVQCNSAVGETAQQPADEIAQLIARLPKEDILFGEAAGKLVGIGTPALPALMKALESKNPLEAGVAAMVIGRIGDESVVPLLVDLCKGAEPARVYAAIALGYYARGNGTAIRDLTALLSDRKREVRGVALDGLLMHAHAIKESVEAQARSAAPLAQIVGDDDDDLRDTAAEVLLKLEAGAPAAVSVLLDLLDDKREKVRSLAAATLAQLGRKHRDILPSIEEAARTEQSAEMREKIMGIVKAANSGIPLPPPRPKRKAGEKRTDQSKAERVEDAKP